MPFRDVPARGRARPARHGRLARPRSGGRGSRRDRARARALGGRRAVLQQRRVPCGRARRERRLRDRSGRTPASSRACSTAAVRSGAGCSRPRPSTRCSRPSSASCPAPSWRSRPGTRARGGSASTCAGTREPHWTGDALTATANTHFGSSGTLAWIDRERGLGLVVLASRSSYSGWWSRAGGWADLSAAVVASATARPSTRSGWRRRPRSPRR